MTQMQFYWTIGVGCWVALAVITFIVLMGWRIAAPFGRHLRPGWGPTVNNSWGWFLMEMPSPVFLWWVFIMGQTADTLIWAYWPLTLWTVHYLNRFILFPIRLRNRKKRMPVLIVASAFLFNVVNGTLNGYFLAQGWFVHTWFFMVVGTCFFGIGMWINISSDNRLLALRKPGDTRYQIPNGGLFRWLSSPNLVGEMIEWIGFFIAVPSWASFSFGIWTLANLLPRARDHHDWYLRTFPEYPTSRKVVVPFVW